MLGVSWKDSIGKAEGSQCVLNPRWTWQSRIPLHPRRHAEWWRGTQCVCTSWCVPPSQHAWDHFSVVPVHKEMYRSKLGLTQTRATSVRRRRHGLRALSRVSRIHITCLRHTLHTPDPCGTLSLRIPQTTPLVGTLLWLLHQQMPGTALESKPVLFLQLKHRPPNFPDHSGNINMHASCQKQPTHSNNVHFETLSSSRHTLNPPSKHNKTAQHNSSSRFVLRSLRYPTVENAVFYQDKILKQYHVLTYVATPKNIDFGPTTSTMTRQIMPTVHPPTNQEEKQKHGIREEGNLQQQYCSTSKHYAAAPRAISFSSSSQSKRKPRLLWYGRFKLFYQRQRKPNEQIRIPPRSVMTGKHQTPGLKSITEL